MNLSNCDIDIVRIFLGFFCVCHVLGNWAVLLVWMWVLVFVVSYMQHVKILQSYSFDVQYRL